MVTTAYSHGRHGVGSLQQQKGHGASLRQLPMELEVRCVPPEIWQWLPNFTQKQGDIPQFTGVNGHPLTRTSWTDTNLGRRFLACPQINDERCINFDWVDPPHVSKSIDDNTGYLAVTRTSWTDTNPCRRFLACPQINGERCIYFDWVDSPMCQRALMIIPGLLRVRNRMEADITVLVQANRNLKKYLIFSWLSFAFFLLLSQV
ncbi:zinc finger, GRF-type containing protein [Tanacetum coccineum]